MLLNNYYSLLAKLQNMEEVSFHLIGMKSFHMKAESERFILLWASYVALSQEPQIWKMSCHFLSKKSLFFSSFSHSYDFFVLPLHFPMNRFTFTDSVAYPHSRSGLSAHKWTISEIILGWLTSCNLDEEVKKTTIQNDFRFGQLDRIVLMYWYC